MPIDTSQRSDAPEIMDDFQMEGELLRDALDKIANINQLLGGNQLSIQGLEVLLQNIDQQQPIRILDLGCGNGDMLRKLAQYAKKHHRIFQLEGVDANQFTIGYAEKLSESYPNITYRCADIFKDTEQPNYDVILCTLTLHHFKDEAIITLIKQLCKQAQLGIVINDLHRSSLAYYLFKLVCFVFRLNRMSREDGLVSILRGFKKTDFLKYTGAAGITNYTLRWKWAFRYQWIIKNN